MGLGELQTHSALNQPFYGEIELFDVEQNALDAVKASLASQSAFEQAGIERPHALTRLQFTPMMGPRGEPMIQVITREPIREPYLDLLVEVIWPEGRLVKEYAVLLDPPAVGGQRMSRPVPSRSATPRPQREVLSPLVAAAQSSASPRREPDSAESLGAQRPGSADTANSAQSSASRPSREVVAEVDVETVAVNAEIPASAADLDFPMRYGPVRAGDGLIKIARRLAPPGATLEQTAMAIYRNSQDAFNNGDINQLRIGAEFVIPTAAELFALPPQAALAQYRSALAGRPVVAAPLTDVDARLTIATSEVSEVAMAEDEPADEVPVDLDVPALAPESALVAAEALAPAPSPLQADVVRESELLLLREVSEANRQEATELRTRIKELEAQLDDISRLLELRNAQLSSLAMAADQAPGTVANELAEAGDSAGAATQAETADTSPAAVSAPAPSAEDASSNEPEAVSGVDPMTVISAWRQAMPSWELLLLGAGLLLALLGLMRFRRRRQAPMVAAVDVDDDPHRRDMDNEPFSADLQLDPEWPIAERVGPMPANLVATHATSAPIMPVDQLGSSWQGQAIELDALTGEPALATDGVTQHGMVASEPAAEPGLGAASASALVQKRELMTEGGPDRESAPVPKREPEIGPEPALAAGLKPKPVAGAGKDADEFDGLAAADVYLTYGRYQDAERMLRETITAVGESPELLYKLAETYLAAGDMAALAPLADRMRSAADPEHDAERWARIEDALAGGTPEVGSLAGATLDVGPVAGEAPEVGPVVDDDDADDDEELFLDLDELEQVVESSPAQPPALPFVLDQPAVDNRSVDEGQGRYELDLAALDVLTSAESGHAALPEAESQPFGSESSESFDQQSLDHVGDLELPILADLPDDDATTLVAATAADRAADQDAGGPGRPAVAIEEGGDERWPIETDEGWDEVGLKLDLARAYLDMDDPDAASAILKEVVAEGRDEQRREAEALLAGLS